MRLKKMLTAKNTFFASLVLLLVCLAAILFFRFSQEKGTAVSLSDSADSGQEAVYYEGEKDTAFLLAAPQYGSLYQPLLRELNRQGYPVLVSPYHLDASWNPDEQTAQVEQSAQLLAELSSVEPKNQVWIGIHDGATALLDQIVGGTLSSRAAVLLSPILDSKQIDNAIIVNGNYQNQTDWINSLSPDMARQPILFLTSNNDNLSTPYQMTLLYNKFSTDEIIHVGGVYHAKRNGIFLSIIDRGFHCLTPVQTRTLAEISSFLSQIPQPVSLPVSSVPAVQNILTLCACVLLLIVLSCAAATAPSYAPEISFGLPSALSLKGKGRLFGVIALSGLVSMLCACAVYLPLGQRSDASAFAIGAGLFSFWLSARLFAKLFRLKISPAFQTISIPKKNALFNLIALLLFGGCLFIMLDISSLLPLYRRWILPIVCIVAGAVFLLGLFLTLDELLRENGSMGVRIGFYLIFVLPFLLTALTAAVFLGSSAGFYCLILLALLVAHTLLARILFALCGHILPAALLPACFFGLFAVIFPIV